MFLTDFCIRPVLIGRNRTFDFTVKSRVFCVFGEALLKRNAMLVYPYIQDGSISHGKAAEMLGIGKFDLIVLYGKMGLPYLDETEDELEEDMETIRNIRGEAVC